MRVTIIPADGLVIVDGVGRSGLALAMDPAIHAVQWYGVRGEVEYRDPDGNGPAVKPPNLEITSLDEFQDAIDAWQAAAPVPSEPPPPPVPQPLMPTPLEWMDRLPAARQEVLLDVLDMTPAGRRFQKRMLAAREIDPSHPETQAGVAMLLAAGAITQEEADALLAPPGS